MELNGFVQNGVIVLTGGESLPEGTPVTVTCGSRNLFRSRRRSECSCRSFALPHRERST